MSTSPSSVLSAPSVVSSTRSRKLFVLIHGILTKSTAPAWIDRLAHYLWLMEPGCETVKRRYTAGPFPIWNVFVKNHILARALAEELRPYCEDGAELHFVTHSNGADIALKTIRRLAQEGHKTNVAIFIGAALRSDIEASGLYELLELGAIRAAFAYCSSSDLALRLHAT